MAEIPVHVTALAVLREELPGLTGAQRLALKVLDDWYSEQVREILAIPGNPYFSTGRDDFDPALYAGVPGMQVASEIIAGAPVPTFAYLSWHIRAIPPIG